MIKKKRKLKLTIFKKIGHGIYKIVDKLIITPISRIIYRINKILKKHAGIFDKLLNTQHSLIILSLFIAFFAFVLVSYRSISIVETESEILSNQAIETTYNEEKYVIEGIPNSVDIILMGRKSDLYLAKQLGDHKVVLDLSDYKTGEYTVKLKYNHSVASISYKLDPSTVTVKISEKESASKALSYDLLNQDGLNEKLNVSEVKLNQSEVYVKGSHETLNKVAIVKALIDVTKLELKEAGNKKIEDIPVVAYDENGKLVENVEIVPNTVSANLKVDSYYADVPVKVVPDGKLTTGYAIASATSSVAQVRIYGEQSAVNSVQYIQALIDTKDLSSDKEYKVTLTKPSGVRSMSETTTTVKVKVGKEETREIKLNSIDYINLNPSYAANLASKDSEFIVILKGVGNVIEKIDPSTVTAYVDLNGYVPQTNPYNDVPVNVKGNDLTVNYEPKMQTVSIYVRNANK